MAERVIWMCGGVRAGRDIHSLGRIAFLGGRFSPAQVGQIARTVRRVPEVMLKVTGGGTKVGAVKAHLDYISRKGRLEIETDTGDLSPRSSTKRSWRIGISSCRRVTIARHATYNPARAPGDWARKAIFACRLPRTLTTY